MSETPFEQTGTPSDEAELRERRRFLQGMGKWSGAAIGAAVAGAWFASAPDARAGWLNRRIGGGSWINRGGGGGWINRRLGGGSWINRR